MTGPEGWRRGLAVGDYDSDGRAGGRQNNAGAANHRLGLKLLGTQTSRHAIGARNCLVGPGVCGARGLKNAGGRYLSCYDPSEILGLGPAKKVDWLEIRWPAPGQQVDRYTDLAVERYMEIMER